MEKLRHLSNGSIVDKPICIDTLLVLEKSFESNGQQCVENLNILEQILVGIVEKLKAKSEGSIKSNFIVRRLPTYTAPFVNQNEYGVILEDFDFTLASPISGSSRDSLQDATIGKITPGHVEIFPIDADDNQEQDGRDANNSLALAINCQEVFKNFATVFQKIFLDEVRGDEQETCAEKVQLLCPHLLHDLKCNSDVPKIFTLTQPSLTLSKEKRSKCRITVDPLKSVLIIKLDQTVMIVRPCLFLASGYGRLNNSLLERIPLFHPAIISIGESLTKGCFLTPSNSETLWTIQFWPCESHIISTFHPSSVISRIFKVYGSFTLSPVNFLDYLNEGFVVGVQGVGNSSENLETNYFGVDFLITSFLYELEKFPQIEDWGPGTFTQRFANLLKSAVDSYEKGFYPHYFTKANILRGFWGKSAQKEKNVDTNDDRNIVEASGDVFDYGEYEEECYKEHYPADLEELEDDFGFQLDHLSVLEEDKDTSMNKISSDRVHKTLNPFSSLSSARSSVDEQAIRAANRKSKSLSEKLGTNILKKFSALNKNRSSSSSSRPKSMTDIASGFEEMVNQMRREQTTIQSRLPPKPDEPAEVAETSFSQKKTRSASVSSSVQQLVDSAPRPLALASVVFDNEGFQPPKESIYSLILQYLNEISITGHCSDVEMLMHLERCKKVLHSQGELILIWSQIMDESPKPKYVCPHTFSSRQIQYISLVVQMLSKCSPSNISTVKGDPPQMPSWEISGDILRTVLYQLRSDALFSDSLKIKEKHRDGQAPRKFSFKTSKSFSEGSSSKQNGKARFPSKFSFRKSPSDICKSQGHGATGETPEVNLERNTQFALEDPETAATHRLLQWLWQLRNSEIGRLSNKAQKYIEALHHASHVNSHFLEQFSEMKILRSTAIRSAVAVSRIMADEKYLPHVPLIAASKKGWMWAEMVLSLVSWNQEKGILMCAEIPSDEGKILVREIQTANIATGIETGKLNNKLKKSEPDTEAATLAFHSETATPLGWNDFEDPRRPGPQTVSILLFSSLGYFGQWEMISGNIVQTMVRLQKFNYLQHVGSLLFPPHRKTALNEVRKLNKSVSFRTFQFDDNVMTKTFRRLASLRNTRSFFNTVSSWHPPERPPTFYTCQQMGCNSNMGETTITMHNGKELECTRF